MLSVTFLHTSVLLRSRTLYRASDIQNLPEYSHTKHEVLGAKRLTARARAIPGCRNNRQNRPDGRFTERFL